MGIRKDSHLTKYIEDYNNQEDDEGNKNTGFSDDMLIILDIITIYKKMEEAHTKILQSNSRLFKGY